MYTYTYIHVYMNVSMYICTYPCIYIGRVGTDPALRSKGLALPARNRLIDRAQPDLTLRVWSRNQGLELRGRLTTSGSSLTNTLPLSHALYLSLSHTHINTISLRPRAWRFQRGIASSTERNLVSS